MTDHAPLIPSFRDSSYMHRAFGHAKPTPKPQLRPPTVLEVEHILAESPAGKLGQAVSTEGWPWLERGAFLADAIPGIKLHSLGGLAPFQADGIWGPYEWYYRERGGYASLRLAPIATFPGVSDALYSAQAEVEEFAGTRGWVADFLALWSRLSKATFLYRFESKKVMISTRDEEGNAIEPTFSIDENATGRDAESAGWGHSAEEAWQNAAQYAPIMDEKFGWTRELQEKRRELMEISREPLNADERVYPLEDPDFTVKTAELSVDKDYDHFLAPRLLDDSKD